MSNKKWHYNHITRTRIIDGDSIEADIDIGFRMHAHNMSIRIRNVDTPEHHTHMREASELIIKMAQSHFFNDVSDLMIISFDWDMYGRIIGDFAKKSNSLRYSTWLLKNNLAKEYAGSRHDWTEEELSQIVNGIIDQNGNTIFEDKA